MNLRKPRTISTRSRNWMARAYFEVKFPQTSVKCSELKGKPRFNSNGTDNSVDDNQTRGADWNGRNPSAGWKYFYHYVEEKSRSAAELEHLNIKNANDRDILHPVRSLGIMGAQCFLCHSNVRSWREHRSGIRNLAGGECQSFPENVSLMSSGHYIFTVESMD